MQEFIAFSLHCALENSCEPVANIAVIDDRIVNIIKSLLPHYPQVYTNLLVVFF